MTPASRLARIAIVTLVLVLPGATVLAQDVGEVLAEVGYLAEKKKSIETQLDENLERKRLAENEYQNLEYEASDMQVESDRIDAENARLSNEIDNYNSYCNGTFEEPEYTTRMNWCSANGPTLDVQGANLQGQIDNYNAWVQDHNARFDWVDQQEDQRLAEAEALFQEYENVNMQLEALEEILRLSVFAAENQDCASRASLEDMHHCMQTIWDGAQ